MNDSSDKILTYTGRLVCPPRLKSEDVCIEDIAHALASKCRFGGFTRNFYSVAQHSVTVNNFYPYNDLCGLLHDAAEAYIPDVATTQKQFYPTLRYTESICMNAIKEAFGLGSIKGKLRTLKHIDNAVMRLEWEALMNPPNDVKLCIPDDTPIIHWKLSGFWNPIEAERIFLRVYNSAINGKWFKSKEKQ